MNLKLDGKVALITGSTAGIGFAIAETLIEENAIVAINGRTQKRVDAAIKKIETKNKHAKLIPIAADINTEEGMAEVINKIPAVDILINNYGIYDLKSFQDITDQDWLHVFNHNVLSGIRLARHYMPDMLKKNWGRIIFVSSESSLQIPSEMIHYGMSKTAQLSIARGLAELTVNTNVTVNSILPGPTRSEGVEKFLGEFASQNNIAIEEAAKSFIAQARPTSLIQRFIKPEEISSVATFICSPLAAAINGSAIRIEGGLIRTI